MRRASVNKKIFRRTAHSGATRLNAVRRIFMGGMATVLAVAGLVVFATAASAHDNYFQSVGAACNAPGSGSGATLTWTLYNDWNQSETGTFSTSQGSLSTTILSIAASPTQNAVPPAAASQSFTQTFTAAQLAAAGPTISVGWSATWQDGTKVSGTLSTPVSALDLTNGCVPVKTSPTITTALAAPALTSLGNSWGDSATVTGPPAGLAPAGSVDFFVCQTAASSCSSGGSLVGSVGSPSSSSGSASTYDLGTTFTPTSLGTFCFYVTYTPTAGEAFLAASGPAECFSVGPATPDIATTVATPDSTTVGNSWGDSATVTGNDVGGAPAGSMTFSVCTVAVGDTTCSSGGTVVGTVDSPSSTSSDVSTYNLAEAYTPPDAGTYCFYTTYTPSATDNYAAASGPAECFHVLANPQLGTQQSGSASGSGTITLGGSVTDLATVTGNSVGGAPTGSVSFTECGPTASAAVCPSGTPVGTAVTLTGSGDVGTATSAAFTPTAVGSYCFAAVYTPDAVSNYVGADDNVSGTVQNTECFTVTAVTTAATTVTPTTTTPATVATAPTTSPSTTPAAAIAFTGALLSLEWMIGLVALLLGSGLVLAARWRRRSPRHAGAER